jgi:Fe-S-cluster containining protein
VVDVNGKRAEIKFRAIGKDKEGYWRFNCDNLTPKGRCSDYANRPLLCSSYKPGSDPLCWHNDELTKLKPRLRNFDP